METALFQKNTEDLSKSLEHRPTPRKGNFHMDLLPKYPPGKFSRLAKTTITVFKELSDLSKQVR